MQRVSNLFYKKICRGIDTLLKIYGLKAHIYFPKSTDHSIYSGVNPNSIEYGFDPSLVVYVLVPNIFGIGNLSSDFIDNLFKDYDTIYASCGSPIFPVGAKIVIPNSVGLTMQYVVHKRLTHFYPYYEVIPYQAIGDGQEESTDVGVEEPLLDTSITDKVDKEGVDGNLAEEDKDLLYNNRVINTFRVIGKE